MAHVVSCSKTLVILTFKSEKSESTSPSVIQVKNSRRQSVLKRN